MAGVLSWYRGLARPMRWLVWLVVGVVAYFGVIEPMLDRYNKYRNLGDVNLADLERYEGARDLIKRSGDVALLGVAQFGGVEAPGDSVARPLAFDKVVSDILKKHGIAGETITTRTVPLTGSSPLVKKAAANNERIDRITKVLEFQVDPERLVDVLADLEQSPLVTTISNVQVRQVEVRGQPQRAVNASITVETWVRVKKEKPR
ncbi:MAG: hypothetical protein HBSAPP03_27740 [Phycisphaerae bacterium]|nr:MAG: hypothetical protein HBSAPP03_27740 [Phycisphaerae bacterium]